MSIALTFDDGPNHTTTPELLDFLEEEHVTATFFVLGNMVQKNPSVLRRIASSPLGHQIGNHSWSHPDFTTISEAAIKDEVDRTQKVIEDTVGASLRRIMRPPYGAIDQPRRELLEAMGYEVVLWTVDSKDTLKGFPREAKPIADQILKKTHSGSVVLLHDIHKYSVEAVKIALPQLKKRHCTFATVQVVKTQTGAVSCTR